MHEEGEPGFQVKPVSPVHALAVDELESLQVRADAGVYLLSLNPLQVASDLGLPTFAPFFVHVLGFPAVKTFPKFALIESN